MDDVILDFEAELEIQQQISDALPYNAVEISEDEEGALEAELEALMRSDDKAPAVRLELPSVAGLPRVQQSGAVEPAVEQHGRQEEEQEEEKTSPAPVLA